MPIRMSEPDQHEHLGDHFSGHRRQQHQRPNDGDARHGSCDFAPDRVAAVARRCGAPAEDENPNISTDEHDATRMKIVTAPCELRPSQV